MEWNNLLTALQCLVPLVLLQPPAAAGRGLQDPDGGSPRQSQPVRPVYRGICLQRGGGGGPGQTCKFKLKTKKVHTD